MFAVRLVITRPWRVTWRRDVREEPEGPSKAVGTNPSKRA
jgi:hypothetical protein